MTASLGVQVFKSICFEIHVCCFYCHLLLFCHALKNKKMCTGNFGKKTTRVNRRSMSTMIRVMLKLSFYFWDYTHWMTTPWSSLHFNILCKIKTWNLPNLICIPLSTCNNAEICRTCMEQMQESEEKTSPQMALEKSSKSWNNRLLIALLIAQV